MKVAIVILNWNGEALLRKFLPEVIKFSTTADLYVIDNASADGSLGYIEEHSPEIKVIKLKENRGFAGGYNEGLKSIKADVYCLLNSDVEVTAGWIDPVVALMKTHEEVAAVQPKILDYNRRTYFEFAGAAGGFIDNLGYPYCRGRMFDSVEQDHGQYDDEAEIFWASGCAFFIRSQDFWTQNGFDERFFAHQEEIDLCWRLKNSGRKIFYTPKSTVYHVGGGTLDKQSAQKTFLNFRNNLTMMLKNLPMPRAVLLIFFRLVLDGFAGLYLGFKLGLPHLWAVVRAHFSFYTMAPGTLRLRQKHQTTHYYQTKWLIFRHFLSSKNP